MARLFLELVPPLLLLEGKPTWTTVLLPLGGGGRQPWRTDAPFVFFRDLRGRGEGKHENTTHTPSPVACPGTLPARVMGTLAACEEYTWTGSTGTPRRDRLFAGAPQNVGFLCLHTPQRRTLGCRLDSPDLRHGNRLEATPKGAPSSHCRQREGQATG